MNPGTPEALYRAIFGQRADGVSLADPQGRFIEVNNRLCEMLGYEPQELLNRSIRDLVPVPDQGVDPIGFDELRSAGTLHKERRLQRKDGTLLRVDVSVWRLPDGRSLAVVRDLGTLRHAARSSQPPNELLQATEELQRVRSSALDYVRTAEIDEDGNWTPIYYSPAVEKLTGHPAAYYLEDPARWLEAVHPEDRARVLETVERLISGQSNQEEDEYRVVHPDGTVRWVRDWATVTREGSCRRVDGVVSDITLQRQAEEAFRQASQRYETLVNAIDGIVWEADPDTFQFIFVSEQAERLLGYPIEHWTHEPAFWTDHLHPEDREWAVQCRQQSTRDGTPHELEYRMLAVDGRDVWLHDSVDVVVENGLPTRLRGLMVDVSERKQAEAQHAAHLWYLESIDRIDRALQGTTDLRQMTGDVLHVVLSIFDCDRAWLCQPFTERPSWRSMIGRTKPEYGFGESGVGDAMEPSDVRDFESIRAAGGPVIYGPQSDRPITPAETERYKVRSQLATTIYPRVGEPWIFGLHQCTHAREWTREETRLFQEVGARLADALTSLLTYRNLRRSESRLERAERMAHVGWWDRDYRNGYIYLSEETCRIFGLPPDQQRLNLAEWKDHWLALIHPDDRDAATRAVAAALEGGPAYDLEYRLVRPDGEERFVRSQGEVTLDESGEPLRMFGTMQDVTDRKLLEAKNEQLASQFYQVQKMESIGRLAGGIAHDFNNLLVPIIGYVELNLELSDAQTHPSGDLVQVRRPDLVQIRRAAERAADLTRQILAFSRQQVLELQPIDLNETVEGFKDMLQRLIGEDIQLDTFLTPEPGLVRADKGQIEQVVMNLAVNARDAMTNGGRLTIETDNAVLDQTYVEKHADGLESGRYVMLAVSDTGEGMDATTREHIFDPFFTTKERGKGTGLGLATVFGIIKQHRGHIAVYSELEHGTTFKIYLPVTDEAARDPAPAAREPASLHGTESVLVVEDEEMVRDLVCETLASHGYDVLEAESPGHALELASQEKTVHLLLTDVIMPEMNGRVLYERVSGLQRSCRVLYMSGYTRNVIVHHNIMEEGINFLPKPFTINALTRKVREVLDAQGPIPPAF